MAALISPSSRPRYIGRELFAPEHRILVRGGCERLEKELGADARVRESNHRIKNSLQLVSSMLAMQARATADPAVAGPLLDAARRVSGIARLHERLQFTGDHAVQAGALLADTCAELAAVTGCDLRGVRFDLEVQPVSLPAEAATTLALIVNELASNALKHAYRERGGTIHVRLSEEAPARRLVVRDDGPGIAPGAAVGLGLSLVQQLARKIGGVLTVESTGAGVCAVLDF